MGLSKNHQLLSKIATNDRHGENSPYFDGWKAYDENPYHPTKNRDGVIQMGLAENQVWWPEIQFCAYSYLTDDNAGRASTCRINILNVFICLIMFQLCFDLIQEWIRKNPKASICTAEGVNELKNIANFQDYHGLPEFRQVYIFIYLYLYLYKLVQSLTCRMVINLHINEEMYKNIN
jgi:hypothetical protein